MYTDLMAAYPKFMCADPGILDMVKISRRRLVVVVVVKDYVVLV